ncbi:MAG TPA: DUF4271 domain-containing protein [Puia sp.]|nr:DUF4271 domain-containing protein [Puia sp.]
MRLSIILITCLLFFGRLRAQNDTITPPPPKAAAPAQIQDSTAQIRRDSIRRVRRDSIRRVRRDSIARVRQDSMARVRQDSIARLIQDTVVQRTPDTTIRRDSVKPKPAASTAGPPAPASPAASTGPPPLPEEVHQSNSKDTLFYLIVVILFYFATIRIFFEKYFNNLLTLFFRVSLRQQQIREQVLQTPLPSLLLNVLFVISAGLYACFLLHYSRWGAGVNFWILYLNCMGLLAAIYLVKFVVLKFVGWVFSISRATDIYIFIVFLVNKMLGIFLLPFLIVIIFSGQEWREVFITISLAMVFVLWGYRVLASYRPVRNEIKLTPFYFLLYLCAFEIAPLLLIYKVLLTYLEKVY